MVPALDRLIKTAAPPPRAANIAGSGTGATVAAPLSMEQLLNEPSTDAVTEPIEAPLTVRYAPVNRPPKAPEFVG